MNIKETMEFIESVDWVGSRPGLERVSELLRLLGNPEKACKYIHVAGTNGKGSTASMIASILQEAGYCVGLNTSPYLWSFNERMQVNGQMITDEELCEVTELIKPFALGMEDSPTEFEIVSGIAFEYFKRKGCDYVVLEVGMGGRLDATNVVENTEVAVLTNIGLDHTKELGDTVELIAAEKAGIIKPGCSVVAYDQKQSVMDVFRGVAEEKGAAVYCPADFTQLVPEGDSREGQVFSYKGFAHIQLPLLGAHQLNNAAVALEAIEALRARGVAISEEAVREGMRKTVWPARFEIVSRDPWFIVDGGHNPQCAETVRDNLRRYFPEEHHIMMVGILADKDVDSLTDIIDIEADEYITATPNSPRAMSSEELAERLKKYGKPVTACASIEEAVRVSMRRAAETNGIACCVGSLYMAGEARVRGLEIAE